MRAKEEKKLASYLHTIMQCTRKIRNWLSAGKLDLSLDKLGRQLGRKSLRGVVEEKRIFITVGLGY